MNKNVNTVVELTEKELACVTGGGIIADGIVRKNEGRFGWPY